MELSIIVAVYNEEKYIHRCINSVLGQSFCDYELIIVDDGSTDRTPDICDEYSSKDSRIIVVHKKNGGLISARMKGVEIARGNYISFIDGDDWIDSDLNEKLMRPMLDDVEIDISISAYLVNYEQGNEQIVFEKDSPVKMTSGRAIQEMFEERIYNWSGCGKIYRKCIVEPFINEWWSDNSYGEDTEWNWKLFNNARMVFYSAESGYHYFNNMDSMMHKELSMEKLIYIDRIERIISETDQKSKLYGIVNKRLILYCSNNLIELYKGETKRQNEIEKCKKALINALERTQNQFSERESLIVNYALMDKDAYVNRLKKDREALVEEYHKLKTEVDIIYIYGAGVIGKWVADTLKREDKKLDGFVVSKPVLMDEMCMGIPVYSIENVKKNNKKIGFLVAVNKQNEEEIKNELNSKGFDCYKSVGKYSISYY